MNRMNTLKQHLEVGKPYVFKQSQAEQKRIVELGEAVQRSCVEAHRQLYEGFGDKNPEVIVFTDDPNEPDKYISFRDKLGNPCYTEFVPGNSATDIGIRGVNPDFEGVINPTTVVHADVEAVQDFKEKGAPQSVIDALDATRLFNGYIVNNIVRPYLWKVADEYGLRPEEFTHVFYPEFPCKDRAHTVTRVIMYHLDAKEGMRPVGTTDGVPLLIKQHNDKSAFTVDSVQTSTGLQYYDQQTRSWANAGTDVAVFRGSAPSFIPDNPPPTAHRVLFEDDLREKASPNLTEAGLGRIAVPTFVTPTRPPLVRKPNTVASRSQSGVDVPYF